MSIHPREKLATQVDANLLAEVRALARSEGRQIQALWMKRSPISLKSANRRGPGDRVMSAYLASHPEFEPLHRTRAE